MNQSLVGRIAISQDANTAAFVALSHSPFKFQSGAEDQGRRYRESARRAGEAVRRYDPSLVVFFGLEHRRTLTSIVPAITIVTANARGYGDYGLPTDNYTIASTEAQSLLCGAIERDFDVASAENIALDHGFGDSMVELFGSIGARRVDPILLNCSQPPISRVARIIDFGRIIGEIACTFGERVLFVGTGGLSHNPPLGRGVVEMSESDRERNTFASVATEVVDVAWDERFLASLRASDWVALRSLDSDESLDNAGGGAHEVRSWLAALAAANVEVDAVSYDPVAEWITGMGVAVGGLPGGL